MIKFLANFFYLKKRLFYYMCYNPPHIKWQLAAAENPPQAASASAATAASAAATGELRFQNAWPNLQL